MASMLHNNLGRRRGKALSGFHIQCVLHWQKNHRQKIRAHGRIIFFAPDIFASVSALSTKNMGKPCMACPFDRNPPQ
jgi:hypothetical protein